MTTHGLRPGQMHVPHRVLHAGRRVATILALAVVGLLALDQRYGWLNHRPGGDAFDVVQQPVFMALFALGAVLAMRWRLLGGIVAAFTSAGLVVFASRQFEPVDAGPGWVTIDINFDIGDGIARDFELLLDSPG